MNKKNALLIYRLLLIIIGIVGVTLNVVKTKSIDIFSYYTIQTNIFIVIVFIVLFVQSFKKDNDTTKKMYLLKYVATTSITLTFLIYHFVLKPQITQMFPTYYSQPISDYIVHYIVPWMAIIDFAFFEKQQKINWKEVFYCMIVPVLYLIFSYIRAFFIKTVVNYDSITKSRFPYFFIDYEQVGVFGGGTMNSSIGVVGWVGVITLIVLAIGFVFCFINYFMIKKK